MIAFSKLLRSVELSEVSSLSMVGYLVNAGGFLYKRHAPQAISEASPEPPSRFNHGIMRIPKRPERCLASET